MKTAWQRWRRLLGVGLILATYGLQAGEISQELSDSYLQQIKDGKLVVLTEDIAGKPWPRVRLYRRIAAKPEEVAAVFTNYPGATKYIPNLLKSEISKQVTPCVAEVDYGVDIPILPDEYYTARNSLSMKDGVYRIDWKLLRATQTKDSEGCLRIEPYGDESLICYRNLVTPGSMMAPLLRGKAIEQMRETVTSIAREVESQKKNSPAQLAKEVDALRAALASGS